MDAVQGKTKIYSGIGFDIPWNGHHFNSDPEKIYRAVNRAFDAGADGVKLSRQYDEMRLPNLRAAGRAIRERAPAWGEERRDESRRGEHECLRHVTA